MQRNATTGESERADLPPQQIQALSALLTGAAITAAAEAAKVERATVHRWLRDDWAFQAAYNGLRRDFRREAEARIDQIALMAVEAVAAAIEAGDVRAALAVLRSAGVLSGRQPEIGPECADEVAEEAEVAARERSSSLKLRRITAF